MNDRHDAGHGADQGPGHGADPYELVGYDAYGQPVYRQVPAQRTPQAAYDPYAQQQAYGYDPHAADPQQPAPHHDPYGSGRQQAAPAHDPYAAQGPYDPYHQGTQGPYDPYHQGTQGPYDPYHQGTQDPADPYHQGTQIPAGPYDPYGQAADGGQQQPGAGRSARIPQQTGPAQEAGVPQDAGERQPAAEEEYRTEQFAFVEEPDGDSEDVIDWLKFTENRTERREEARRRARGRITALLVALALVAVAGLGWLWYAGKLPGLSSSGGRTGTTAAGAQKRDVIVVHLHDTGRSDTSTVLLVDNATTKRGSTVLLPNSLALTGDDGTTTTLAKSVDDDGASGTRDQLDTVLGTDIQGTWRLDTPYLQNLVDLVGDIDIDTDADVPDPDAKGKGTTLLVHRGTDQTLSGKMAVAYATYRAAGESQNAQLERFGQVMQGVLRKISSDPADATTTVQTLAQILDPPLTDKDLGAFLARLADRAKGGDYRTTLLPVRSDGTLSARTSDSVVKDVLGGTARSPDAGSAVRVSVENATGVRDDTEKARVVLLNGGFTFLEGGTAGTRAASRVLYPDPAGREKATEVAKTLGLPAGSVARGTVSSGADVLVVLGQDYRPAS
ncbi:LytR C-terminal domain-containing protein [Streptomyces sp. TG1A-8]|uniref:LCP family protein n=1 Tax=Streptomyces sp. TG1A-8 TaxID=3051385 RepID=UPI00265C539D|nr:LCP family protein [Streptomyces sp. TG1A-8]MDO0927756.1 LytR C-terminal domain-containing protein [Streptomyces sp. TG1A-8]